MNTLEDIVSEYQNAVNEKDWTRDFSDLVKDLDGHKYGNKLNLKNEFLEKIGINYQHDNLRAGSLQSHAQNLLYLQSLGVTDISKVITRHPQIFSYSIEDTLQPHVDYLKELGVTDIAKVVTRLPAILAYSIENNLKPTVEYLTNQCYATILDIEKNPVLVAYSLDKRIKPRHAFLQTKGVEVGYDITVGTMLVPNDKRFAKSDYDEWMSFKENYIERNKE